MALFPVLGSAAAGERLERMVASRQYRDGGFHNTADTAQLSAPSLSIVADIIFGGKKRSPHGKLPLVDPRPVWTNAPETGLRTTWLGHSTVLVEIDGYRVLTDPVWGPRSSPVSWAGPARFHAPPVSIDDLPRLDAVVISHDHYDHLDYGTILALAKRDVPFITSLGVGAHLEGWGIPGSRITELDWWEEATLPGTELRFTAAPSQHFSGRSPRDRNRTLWSSFAIRGPAHAVFFSGDTGLTEEYAAIREKLGRFDLHMIEIGAWHPSWGSIHLGPENALRAHELLGGGRLLPLHWGTFDLALHAWDEPAETLVAHAATRDDVQLVCPRLGGALEPARVEGVDAWWREVPGGLPLLGVGPVAPVAPIAPVGPVGGVLGLSRRLPLGSVYVRGGLKRRPPRAPPGFFNGV